MKTVILNSFFSLTQCHNVLKFPLNFNKTFSIIFSLYVEYIYIYTKYSVKQSVFKSFKLQRLKRYILNTYQYLLIKGRF